MDTSETYIKMCNCPEIQEAWEPQQYDLFAYLETDLNFHIHRVLQKDVPQYYKKFPVYIWLPRQDQLQEMVIGNYELARGLLRWFYDFVQDNSGITTKYMEFNCFSMEQLWLAFVMKELHNKTWNGEKWSANENKHPVR